MKGFQIHTELTLEESLNQVLRNCIGFIRSRIEGEEEIHLTIHELRRTSKRIRALLRLIRDEIGYSHYYRENSFFRDMAGRAADVRDSYVMLQMMEHFREDFPGTVTEAEEKKLHEMLAVKVEQDLVLFTGERGGLESMLDDLEQAEGRIDLYCRLSGDFAPLGKGIKRIYGRAYRYLYGAQQPYTMEAFHEYRKNIKYLLYQMELIRPVYPRLLKAYCRTIEKQEKLLGNTRDLDRFAHWIRDEAKDLPVRLKKRLLQRTGELHARSMEEGLAYSGLIFAERPSLFVKRIHHYWNYYYSLT